MNGITEIDKILLELYESYCVHGGAYCQLDFDSIAVSKVENYLFNKGLLEAKNAQCLTFYKCMDKNNKPSIIYCPIDETFNCEDLIAENKNIRIVKLTEWDKETIKPTNSTYFTLLTK